MSLPDELQSLAALKAKGALTEQEFAQAKAEVIAKYECTSTGIVGMYGGHLGLTYFITATADPSVVEATVRDMRSHPAGHMDTKRKMRKNDSVPAVWDSVGGCSPQERWEFEPGLGAFTSSRCWRPGRFVRSVGTRLGIQMGCG